MKIYQIVELAASIALAFVAIGGAAQSIEAQQQIHFRLLHNSLIVVSVKSGQEGPFDFILDSGADTTIVDPSIASRLGFALIDRIPQTTLAGLQDVSRGSITALSVGSEEVNGVVVLVQDLTEVRKMDSHVEGIAGQNFLAHFNYLLDYRKRLMRVESGSEIKETLDGERLAIDGRNNRILIATEGQAEREAALSLMLDTGAESVVLLPPATRALDLRDGQSGMEGTSTGSVHVQTARLRKLTLGALRLEDLPVVLSNVQTEERIGDGLLPAALFKTLYVNNRESFVELNPKAKKDLLAH